MKKILYILLAVVALIGCTNTPDIDTPDDNSTQVTEFSLMELTRTITHKNSWVEGDKIAIFEESDQDNAKCYVVKSTTTLSLEYYDDSSDGSGYPFYDVSGNKYVAIYPYSDSDLTYAGYQAEASKKFYYGTSDYLTSGGFSSNKTLTFSHAYSTLTFELVAGGEFSNGFTDATFDNIALTLGAETSSSLSAYTTVSADGLTATVSVSTAALSAEEYQALSPKSLVVFATDNTNNQLVCSYTDLSTATNITEWCGGEEYNYNVLMVGTNDIGYNGTEYEIYTGVGLAAFANLVNGTDSNAGAVYDPEEASHFDFGTTHLSAKGKLMNDIDLGKVCGSSVGTIGEVSWTPIGNYGGNTSLIYGGEFDGCGYEVKSLYINTSTSSYQGLFGYTSGANISNLGVSGSVAGYHYVGGVVGYNYDSTITDCYNASDVTSSQGDYIGGVAGYNKNSTITDCYNASDVTSSQGNYIGGVAGYNYDSIITGCCNAGDVSGQNSSCNDVGGVVGCNNNSTITSCYNEGNVSSPDYRISGIVAYNTGGIVAYNIAGTIDSCYNVGDVSGGAYIGGIVGYNSSDGAIVLCCYNAGNVNGTSSVGGVVGRTYSSTNVVVSCYNIGDVSGIGWVGGMVGNNNNGTILSSCYSAGTVSTSSGYYIGGVAGFPGGLIRYCLYDTGIVDDNVDATYYGSYPSTARGGSQISMADVTDSTDSNDDTYVCGYGTGDMQSSTVLGLLNTGIDEYNSTYDTNIAQWVGQTNGYPKLSWQ